MTRAPICASGVMILLPAAGFGRRMGGRDKLLELVDGVPLLARSAARARQAARHVLVGLKPGDTARVAALSGLDVTACPVPDAERGMGHTLAGLIRARPAGISGAMILPADMPDLTVTDLAALIARYHEKGGTALVQATTEDGRPGHPVIFPPDCFEALAALTGDQGARDVLQANADRRVRVALKGTRALTDLDTPDAWEAWRAAREQR